MRFVPPFMTVAAPMPMSTIHGSAQLVVVKVSMKKTNSTDMTVMSRTSATVPVVARAVDTASPVSAPPSPTRARISSSSEMVTVYSAAPSL